ncbi:MAG: HTH-type transcriptional repressor CarH [Fimbriimonadaceae bacterium]|nr:HTH-type transcriptional repressor CarH [Fimbriimonadaceae bacterium]
MQFPIRNVSQITGLSSHTIRAWERRYSAVTPERSGTNRRLYRQGEVERLKLLHRAVSAGFSIGSVAKLSDQALQELLGGPAIDDTSEGSLLEQCRGAVRDLDGKALESVLVMVSTKSGMRAALHDLILPLLDWIDTEWARGKLTISQEHLASAVIRTFLEKVRSGLPVSTIAPRIVVTTPANQIHEIGALLVGITASMASWQVIYLGPNLPASEIVDASHRSGAAAVALSLVFPTDDERIGEELRTIRKGLKPSVILFVGGRAAPHYQRELAEVNAILVPSLAALEDRLAGLRPN